jgi:hypothetical protein
MIWLLLHASSYYIYVSTSLYTMLSVHPFESGGRRTPRLCESVQRERATYSCPCAKTGLGRWRPTVVSDCPCDLLIVIANVLRKGNCRRCRVNGSPEEAGESNDIRGMKARFPA